MAEERKGKLAALILAKAKPEPGPMPEEDEGEEMDSAGLSDAFSEFSAAQRAGDDEGAMQALKSFIRMCVGE